MSDKPVILLGSGGHAKVCIDTLRALGRTVLGILDPYSKLDSLLGVSILGADEIIKRYDPSKIEVVNGMGALPGSDARYILFKKIKLQGYYFAILKHPSAVVSDSAILHEGVQVMAGAIIQSSSSIGVNTIINTRVSIDHDCEIGMHSHLAPGAILSGGVFVGTQTFIGAGVSVIQNISIGDQCVIAAGSTVYKNIPRRTRYIPRKMELLYD